MTQLVQETWETGWAGSGATGVPTDLGAFERAVEAFGRPLGRQVVTDLVAAGGPAARPRCAGCRAPLRGVDPARPVTVTGVVGDDVLRRSYSVCPAGHGSATPADAAWRLGPDRVTPTLAERLGRLAVETPFDREPTLAQALLGVAVDGETLRRLAEGVGSVAEAAEQAAQAAVAAGRLDGGH
ncbi:MAG: hypothetical protein K6V97_12295 [Actinomycetia bacterium]|nr:hypothetical protein [Actinomycetes bacterium]